MQTPSSVQRQRLPIPGGLRRASALWHALPLCLVLAACGGGSGSAADAPVAGAPVPAASAPAGPVLADVQPTPESASRFLTQATFGPSVPQIDHLVQAGYRGWLDEQFAKPQTLHAPEVPLFGDPITPKFVGFYPIQSTFWRQAATADDALRQRVAFALSEIFVISINDMSVIEFPRGVASYLDMLGTNAFGNFRQLIEGVALHPMMGLYLSHLGNRKEDPATGRIPDENFAREVMQLFTIGVEALNDDGTVRKDAAGKPIENYGNDDVMGLAKVFTGWSWAAPETTDARFFAAQPIPLFFSPDAAPDRDIRPMQLYPQFHSASAKSFLGLTIPAGTDGPTSLKLALDKIVAHPNVGPFIGRQLIQRLVTSNPSPAYVKRVAAAFADNGSGVRGDMKAVLRAVLLDDEARAVPATGDSTAGKVREPMLRITAWMRAFNVKSNSGGWAYYFASDPVTSIGQAPLQAPSVFNYFRPGYVPPRSEIGNAGGVAPEMQIVGETTVASYLNVVESSVGYFGTGFLLDLNSDYADEVAIADDAPKLVARMNLLLAAGTMSAANQALVQQAVESVPVGGVLWRENRARLAVLMSMASPDFIIQK